MNRKDLPYYLAAVALLFFIFGKKLGKASEEVVIGTKVGGTSLLPDATIAALASKLRSIFDEWYIDQQDETRVIDIWRQLPDELAVRKLYGYFGNFSTTLYGSGDLDYWMSSRISEPARVSCAKYAFGINNF